MITWRIPLRNPSRLRLVNTRLLSTSAARRQRHTSIAEFLQHGRDGEKTTVSGWIQTVRKHKRVAFARLSDGSTVDRFQAVLSPDLAAPLSNGTAVELTGEWKTSTGTEQSHELQVTNVKVLGQNDAESNPLQPKDQTAEYLRTIPHLRPRIPVNGLLLRLRSQLIASLTTFFNEQSFVQCHTPIITSSDCEGAGEVFAISSNSSQGSTSLTSNQHDGQDTHFFRTPKYLTVSAQLHLEALSQAVNKVWTLSPTFRAEHSDTPRHLSEFYMLEAEIAFTQDLNEVMDLVENMLRSAVSTIQKMKVYSELLQTRQDSEGQHDTITASTLEARWNGLAAAKWPRIRYKEAIKEIQAAQNHDHELFSFQPRYEDGLQAEHERWIARVLGRGKPVFVTDYPRAQKPFYMPPSISTSNTNGSEDTVACFDLLVPDLCELAGGSLREHQSAELMETMREKGVNGENLDWYQDLRRYGSVPHGGFGLGFDRLMCYLGGVGNVRDIVAFPRWYGRADC